MRVKCCSGRILVLYYPTWTLCFKIQDDTAQGHFVWAKFYGDRELKLYTNKLIWKQKRAISECSSRNLCSPKSNEVLRRNELVNLLSTISLASSTPQHKCAHVSNATMVCKTLDWAAHGYSRKCFWKRLEYSIWKVLNSSGRSVSCYFYHNAQFMPVVRLIMTKSNNQYSLVVSRTISWAYCRVQAWQTWQDVKRACCVPLRTRTVRDSGNDQEIIYELLT